MLAFIDESGDAGRKIDKGSSPFFVVAIVTFADLEEANRCDGQIDRLRTELRLRPDYEFHFSRNSWRIREAFLDAVAPYGWEFHRFALNKDPAVLTGRGFNFKGPLYKWTVRTVCDNAKPYLRDARVVIDKSGDRQFQRELRSYLMRQINQREEPNHIKSVTLKRSDGNNLLQLADYVASLSSRAIMRKRQGAAWRNRYLRPHAVTEQTWP